MEDPLLRMKLELPDHAASVSLCRRLHRFLLGELALTEERAADIELAISEAAGNVIRHAYAHPGHHYRVHVEVFHDRLRLIVEDEGRGFLRAEVGDPGLEATGGRGIWLIEQLADEVTFSTLSQGGSRVVADFHLSSRPAFPPPWTDE